MESIKEHNAKVAEEGIKPKKRALTDKDRARIKAWQQANRDKLKEYAARYRAKKGSGGKVTSDFNPIEPVVNEGLIMKYGEEKGKKVALEMEWGVTEEEAVKKVMIK